MVLFLDHVAIAVRDLDGAKRFFGLLGFEVADAVVIQGQQFSQYMGVPDLEADHVIMALPGAEPRQQIHLSAFTTRACWTTRRARGLIGSASITSASRSPT